MERPIEPHGGYTHPCECAPGVTHLRFGEGGRIGLPVLNEDIGSCEQREERGLPGARGQVDRHDTLAGVVPRLLDGAAVGEKWRLGGERVTRRRDDADDVGAGIGQKAASIDPVPASTLDDAEPGKGGLLTHSMDSRHPPAQRRIHGF